MAEIDGETVQNGAGRSTAADGEKGPERRERAMAEAALTLAEIGTRLRSPQKRASLTLAFTETLLAASEGVEPAEDDPEALLPIRSLAAVEAAIPSVELSRQHVVEEMESSVQRSLTELVRQAGWMPQDSSDPNRTRRTRRYWPRRYRPRTTFLFFRLWSRVS